MSKIQKHVRTRNQIMNKSLQTCRICLKKCTQKAMSLFETYKNAAVFEHINLLSNIKICEGDGFPDKICKECLVELDISINFKEKCEFSNSYLLKRNSNNYNYNTLIKIKKEEPEYDSNETYDCNFTNSLFDEERLPKEETKPKSKESDVCKEQKKIVTKPKLPAVGSFQCYDCNEIFKSKCKLGVHWKKVHKPQSMTCQICKRIFKSINAFKRHQLEISKKICVNVNEVIVQGEGKKRLFQCANCHYSHRHYCALKVHVRTHNGLRPYKCKLCPNAYTQIGSLSSHMETAHNKIRVEITCQYCGKLIKGRRRAYKHLKTHSEERFQCDICKIFIKSKQSLRCHMSSHSGVKSFTCEICAASFYRLGELCNHRRNVHLKAQRVWYDCDVCGYRSCRKELFLRHKAKHTDKNFACAKCGKFFESEGRLEKHSRVHIEEKKHVCPLCDKMFCNTHSLRQHVKNKHKPKELKADKIVEIVEQEKASSSVLKS